MKVLEINCRQMNDGRYTHQSRVIDINWEKIKECFRKEDFNNNIFYENYTDVNGNRLCNILPRCNKGIENVFVDDECERISCVMTLFNDKKVLKLMELVGE